jgi:predicted MFS family arabinose efflux permease
VNDPAPAPARVERVDAAWAAPSVEQVGRDAGDSWVLAAICLSSLLSVLVALSLAPFLPAIARETGTTVAMVGQVPAAANLAAAALGLLGGPIADRYGYRRSLLVGVLAVVIGAAGIALAWSLALLVCAALFTAVSRALVQPVGLTIAGTRFTGAARRRAISLSVAAVAGSGIVGVPLLTGVDALYGWRAAFVALALAGLLALVLSARALPPDAPASGPLRLRSVLAAYAPLLRDRPAMGLIASSFLRPAALWMMGTYISAFLVQAHGLSVQTAGLAFTAFGSGLLVGSLAGGGGRIGALPLRPTVVATAPVTGLVLGSAFLLPVSPAAVMALTFAGFVVNGVGSVALNALLLNEAPAGRATTMSLNGSAQSLGSAVGSSLGGVLLALGGYGAIGVGIMALGAAAAVVVWLSWPAAGGAPSLAAGLAAGEER